MSVLVLDGISLSYGTDVILKNISFSVNKGEKLGIIGVNGAGKSTVANIITGKVSPTSGTVNISGGASIGMLEQKSGSEYTGETVFEHALGFFPELYEKEKRLAESASAPSKSSEYERLRHDFEIHGGNEYKTKIKSMLARFGFSPDTYDTPSDSLSGGQKTKLSLASLLASEKDITILDEPTNHLDVETVEWLENYIKSSSKTFLIISHDRYFLDKVTTDTLEIENLTCIKYSGSYSFFREKKKHEREIQQKHYELQQKEIKRLEDFIANQRKWNRERNIIAAESRQKAIDRMVKVEKPEALPKTVSISIHSASGSFSVLSVRHISKSYDNKTLFRDLSFEITKGERVMVIGRNGCGKSTLLKIINGIVQADNGVTELGYSQKVGYYDQEIQLLSPENTVVDELTEADSSILPGKARSILASYGFYGEDVFKKVSVLSGGEKARLSIAKLVTKNVSFLILDEPTNHLDIPSKEIFEEALSLYEGTILAVSHDRFFINTIGTRIIEIDSDGYSSGYFDFKGNYELFLEKRKKSDFSKQNDKISASKNDYDSEKKAKGIKKSKEKRLDFIQNEIPRLEKRMKEIEAEENENSSDFVKLSELDKEKEEIESKLTKLYDEYMLLDE